MEYKKPITRRKFVYAVGAGMSLIAATVFWRQEPSSKETIAVEKPPRVEARIFKDTFPVRSVERETPKFDPMTYRLNIKGMIEKPLQFTYEQLLAMPSEEYKKDFICVEGWGVKDVVWKGFPLAKLINLSKPTEQAKFITFLCLDNEYSESLTIAQAMEEETILVHGQNGRPLSPEHGFPLRLIVPRMFGYKSPKWVTAIELTDKQHQGYWVKRGYKVDGVKS